MIQLCQVAGWLLLSVGTSQTSRQFVPLFDRGARSLRDSFPFSAEDHRHNHNIANDIASQARDSKQNSEDVQNIPFSEVASSYANGKRCINKVFMEEKTEWETEVTCQHSYNRRCAKSLVTVYNSAQEEECEENYVKKCFIEYSKHAVNVTVNICRTPLVKDCDSDGEEICRTEYESECVTKQEVHDVEDDVVECRTEVEEKCEDETSGYTTNTKCSKWPREVCDVSKKTVQKFTPLTQCDAVPVTLCGPAGCGFKPGVEECHDSVQTVVGDNPEETCSLDPQRTCKHVTKLVPALKEVENCFDVPKEVCVRSEVNPRKVKVPVVKKWCYVVSCPEDCLAAAKRGECPLQCEEHRGNNRCCAPCPLQCQEAARKRELDKSCSEYRGDPQCFYEPPTEPILPEQSCEDLPQCEEYAEKGICLNECWERESLRGDSLCCPTCPEICKDFAAEEKTYRNSSSGLDCELQYRDDASCYFSCPENCQQAASRGETRSECEKYDYLDNCYVPPACSEECLAAARNEQCPQACEQHRGNSECCFECPNNCKEAYIRGETAAECERYSYLSQCYVPPPCPQTCSTAAANGQCPRECERFEGNRECCGGCPRECKDGFSRGETVEKCRKYNMEYEACFYEPCPERCQTGAAQGRCEAGCESYAGNLKCCVPKCDVECAEAALWGECPAKCKGFSGNPDCCAPTCPAKCSNRRRKECSAAGVSECDGIPGCCPEHFDLVFGAGVYLANEK